MNWLKDGYTWLFKTPTKLNVSNLFATMISLIIILTTLRIFQSKPLLFLITSLVVILLLRILGEVFRKLLRNNDKELSAKTFYSSLVTVALLNIVLVFMYK